ncbi:MAG: MaoC family dehydratase [Candidatus Dormibacteraeota bacterium]|nr:MaoC family dehydratase [Candidatus Dormibacteraeota bacterium]
MALKEGWRGRYYEDFEIGDVYQFPLGRTVTEADNAFLTMLTMNSNPIHFDAHYAGRTPFGKILINSGFTIALVLGMSVSEVSQNALANLEMTDIKLSHPVFAGDTIYVENRVLEKRESTSRPYAGVVAVQTRGVNQDGEVIMTYRRSFLVYKRGQGPSQDLFPIAKQDWPDP